MKINIGLAGYWGWHRGIAYTNKYLYKTLKNDYTVHILKYGRNPISEDFNFDKELNAPVITEVDNNFPDESIFRNWITDNDIKAFSRERLMPMINGCKSLRQRVHSTKKENGERNTAVRLKYPGGHLEIISGSSGLLILKLILYSLFY